MSPKLLCIGRDPLLLQTRLRLLSLHYVAEATNVLSDMSLNVAADFATKEFDLILLCHTLSEEESRSVISLPREHWPDAKILAMTTERSRIDAAEVDALVGSLEGPSALLRQVQALLREPEADGKSLRRANTTTWLPPSL